MDDLKIGSLCSGAGLLDLSVMDVLDASMAWHCQYDPDDKHQWAAKILDAHWPGVPNHGDITQIDWTSVEPVDILTAGFPCQDLSLAGKRAGLRDGNRSGLWFHVARAIETLRPSLVVIENVPGILSSEADGDLEPCPWCLGDLGGKRRPLRALGAVLADLARLGFDAQWVSLDAADVGAPHKRRRVFLAAWPADAPRPRLEVRGQGRPGGAAALQNPDLPVGGERRVAAPGQAESGGSRADARGRGGAPAADAGRVEPERRGGLAVLGGAAPAEQGEGCQRERAGDAAVDRGEAPADADSAGARPELDREPQRPEADDEHEVLDAAGRVLDWGPYAPAIARWEHVMGRPAPSPVEPGKTGMRLAPHFVEWLMGAPDGWITGVGIPRNAELKAGGNGVVRQQGAEALRRNLAAAPAWLLERLGHRLAPSLPVPSIADYRHEPEGTSNA